MILSLFIKRVLEDKHLRFIERVGIRCSKVHLGVGLADQTALLGVLVGEEGSQTKGDDRGHTTNGSSDGGPHSISGPSVVSGLGAGGIGAADAVTANGFVTSPGAGAILLAGAVTGRIPNVASMAGVVLGVVEAEADAT